MILLSTLTTVTIQQICHLVHVSVFQEAFAKDIKHHRPQFTNGEYMPQSSPCRQDQLRQHDKLISLDALQLITTNSLFSFKKSSN